MLVPVVGALDKWGSGVSPDWLKTVGRLPVARTTANSMGGVSLDWL
jgi:hypothetical protein